MDDIVRQAMIKWPHVPDCFGWLGLDNRGQWYMRDDRVQALGAFQSGHSGAKGSLLKHEKLIDFIHRNFDVDTHGRWFFQNGPQRVYVELESTPHIWRLSKQFEPTSQTGQSTQVLTCLLDEQGRVYLRTSIGLGLVHTMDVGLVADAVTQGVWTLEECRSDELPSRYGYVISPQAEQTLSL
ncbi:hypothetical protein B9Z51_11695 [Limnohabitans sp. T6-5]|uniref:DUF2946 family protein n=1 Tax=Limnohabitans sp. T6-5 TaxID=1100724 RepID=UPI000D37A599|nr:DUF2946 family protein [Limnohabitans sp. T6-5]PUE09509.1 hypothetical protein B9Z51_11695 [Limnohabitans sp. T6-5]